MILAQVSAAPGVVEAIDHAEKMSDRWLFLAAIAFILLAAVTIIRYLVKGNEASQSKHTDFMEKVYGENVKLTAQVLVALQENNALMKKLNDWLEHHQSS